MGWLASRGLRTLSARLKYRTNIPNRILYIIISPSIYSKAKTNVKNSSLSRISLFLLGDNCQI